MDHKEGVPAWAINDFNEHVQNIARVAQLVLVMYEALVEIHPEPDFMHGAAREVYKWMEEP